MANDRSRLLLALVALLANVACGDTTPPPASLDFYVVEVSDPSDTTLGTCASDDVVWPMRGDAARAHPWVVGSSVTAIGSFQKSCGGWFGGPACTSIVPTSVTETNRAAWTYTPLQPDQQTRTGIYGDFAGVLTARAVGIGGVRATFEDRSYPAFELEARAPSSLVFVRHLFLYGKTVVSERALPTALTDAGSFTVVVRPSDSHGVRLCGRAPLTVSDAAVAVVDPRYPLRALEANAPLKITAAQLPSSPSVTLGLGDARAEIGFDVIAPAEIDAVGASAIHESGLVLVRLSASSKGREVAGARILVEIVTREAKLVDEDGSAMPASFETDRPAFLLASTGATVRLTLSVVGSSLPAATVDVGAR
jgi:hypothetical protein